jgi:NAD+ diphosphatase
METIRSRGMIAKECPCCELLIFPRISPAVIVLVERENRVLLARVKRFTSELYSVLAGFVEPGETLEEAVQREIEEEVGIRVKNIRYFGSQPWPFPDSLMIGFTAEYDSGEIEIDETEIVDAGWFDPEKLPTIPGKISIARELIDWFVEARSIEKGIAPQKERSYNPNE